MRYSILLIILFLEVLLFAPLNGVDFTSWSEFRTDFGWFVSAIFEQSVPLLILSVGMTFVLMTGVSIFPSVPWSPSSPASCHSPPIPSSSGIRGFRSA